MVGPLELGGNVAETAPNTRAVTCQQALTLIAELEGDAELVAESLRLGRRQLQAALGEVSSLHFARLLVLPAVTNGERSVPAKLAFEANLDGSLDAFLDELFAKAGGLFKTVFGACAGFPEMALCDRRALRRWVDRHSVRSAAFYAAHLGLTLEQIRFDQRLRQEAEAYLDRAGAGDVRGARELAAGLKTHLNERIGQLAERPRVLAPERRAPRYQRFFWSLVGPRAWVFLLLPLVRGFELAERREQPDSESAEEREARLIRIRRHEDRLAQNGLSHLSWIKPGWFRSRLLAFVLSLIDGAGRFLTGSDRRGPLDAIHFARWVPLEDGRLLFLSNYDGSWEAYVGDFTERASFWLALIWSNTTGFLATRWFSFGGARRGADFRRWVRARQLENQVWYSAYPTLSVSDVRKNARIRELWSTELDEARALEWLRLF